MSKMLATPFASVSAVPDVGENTPKVASVVNVTTAPTAAAPVVSFSVAVNRAGLPAEIDVRAAPDVGSTMVNTIAGAAVVVYATEPVTVVAVVLPEMIV